MRAFINSSATANFVNLNVEDCEKAIAHAKSNGHNQISIPVFIRSGKGSEGLHSVDSIAKSLSKERVFIVSGDVQTREYTPRSSNVVS